MKKIMSLFLSAAMVLGLSGCGSMNNTTKMGLGGAGGGAATVSYTHLTLPTNREV